MNKTVLVVSVTLVLALDAVNVQATPVAWDGVMSAFDPIGGKFDFNDAGPGLDAYVTGSIDVVAGTFTITSTDTWYGLNWIASGGMLYGPGTYTVSTADPAPAVSGGNYTFTVGAGQLGGQFDFAWNGTTGVDTVLVWNVATSGGVTYYTSTDWNGDGIKGAGWLDGFFPGISLSLDMSHPVPLPAAVWLFGSGLLGLVGMARHKKKNSLDEPGKAKRW